MARRVTESITSSTFLPWSRKYSATASATKQARMRSGAGRSEVATTTTDLRHALRAQIVLEKRAHFAVALADQRDHADVGRVVAAHGAEQRALADAAAAEDADALALAAGQQAVDGANAGDQRLGDVLALERAGRSGEKIVESRPQRSAAPPSIGSPKPSSTRPSRPGPARTSAAERRATIVSPSCRPSVSSSGIESTRPSRNPITCMRTGGPATCGSRRNRPEPPAARSIRSAGRPFRVTSPGTLHTDRRGFDHPEVAR